MLIVDAIFVNVQKYEHFRHPSHVKWPFVAIYNIASIRLQNKWIMLLAVLVLKSLLELSLMAIAGRFVLGLMAGAQRRGNLFWQVLDIAARPALGLTRRVSPSFVLDRHIPLAAASWLLVAWVLMLALKIELCATVATACR